MSHMQLFVKRLVSDAEFRRQALEDPNTVMGEFNLTAAERQSLARLCRKFASHGVGVTLAATPLVVAPMGYWY